MTELQFLIEILTKEELSPSLQKRFYKRLGDVEKSLRSVQPQRLSNSPGHFNTGMAMASNQSPSTLAALARHAAESAPIVPAPTTPAAAAALAARNQAIMDSVERPSPKGPRKF